ncbi:DUF2330 domain-containing protein [Streptomyces sp. NPDC048636]|uniref:DUF2330 domain-containing protein n=1 Tax=Streptomyces sp. NPDC048636 TaxID=3155762 RepID=UPI0034167634
MDIGGVGGRLSPGRRRALAVVLALVLVQLGSLVRPAWACGCGGMVPGRNTTIAVQRETSVVRWDGGSEEIVMSLTVGGNAPEAAWIMPVPHRATVTLGDQGLFGEVGEVTAPVDRDRHYFWPRHGDWPFDGGDGDGAVGAPPGDGATAGAPPVGVVGRERLGPFDVARLTATDPDALRDWLERNGFDLPDRLADGLKPYVRAKWEYVAVRLAPAEDGSQNTGDSGGTSGNSGAGGRAVLGGTLDPLRLRFASERLVYPMRLSRLARTAQELDLYVLARHRMEPRGAIGGQKPEVLYAGRVDPGHAPRGELAKLAGRRMFLTAFRQEFPRPERISGDHELRRAARDSAYQRVVYHDTLLTAGGVPVWLLTVGGGLLVTAGVLVAVVRGRRRPMVRRGPGHPAPAQDNWPL